MTSIGRSLAAVLAVPLLTLPASANIEVVFSEGAPKDRFTITNASACISGPVDVTVDLAGSSAGLVFDVTAQGAGVEVFQPFELTSGGDLLTSMPRVRDGDNALTLEMASLGRGQSVSFTIDVDDTIGAREITVSRAEISGATVRVETSTNEASGTFTEAARAIVPLATCQS